MIDKIFNEIFNEDEFYNFEEFSKRFFELLQNEQKKENKENEEKDDDEHSYYHKVTDTYEDGEHTSHVEKEVKDGKVLKDVNETFKIEDKSDVKDTCCEKSECDKDEKLKCYDEKLKEANGLLIEAKETIQKQTEVIGDYQKRCENYENKLSKLRTLLKG